MNWSWVELIQAECEPLCEQLDSLKTYFTTQSDMTPLLFILFLVKKKCHNIPLKDVTFPSYLFQVL
jgi:predicted GTPase